MKKIFLLILFSICVFVGLFFVVSDCKKNDQYSFEVTVCYPNLSRVTATGNLTFKFLNKDCQKSYRKQKSYIRHQEISAHNLTSSVQDEILLLQALTYDGSGLIHATMQSSVNKVLNKYSPKFILNHQDEISDEVTAVLKRDLADFIEVTDLSMQFALKDDVVPNIEAAQAQLQAAEEAYQKALRQYTEAVRH